MANSVFLLIIAQLVVQPIRGFCMPKSSLDMASNVFTFTGTGTFTCSGYIAVCGPVWVLLPGQVNDLHGNSSCS